MEKTTKTWIDILGHSRAGCLVDGRYISKHLGNGRYRVLHDAWTADMAHKVWIAWNAELDAAKSKALTTLAS
jgi:hypothetical protein